MSERNFDKNSAASNPVHVQAELPTQGTALNPVEAEWVFSRAASTDASNGLSGNTDES